MRKLIVGAVFAFVGLSGVAQAVELSIGTRVAMCQEVGSMAITTAQARKAGIPKEKLLEKLEQSFDDKEPSDRFLKSVLSKMTKEVYLMEYEPETVGKLVYTRCLAEWYD